MKTLFACLATFIALGTALPTFASDVTSDRYAPGRTAAPRPVAARTVTPPDDRPAVPSKQSSHCTCERTNRDERPAAARQEPGGH